MVLGLGIRFAVYALDIKGAYALPKVLYEVILPLSKWQLPTTQIQKLLRK
jgi:hypothetical protein